jgi:hypothetical protein
MSTDGCGMGECCSGVSLDRTDGETECVGETAERSPSGARGALMASLARLLGAEETMDSWAATLGGKGRSEGDMWVESCSDGELSIIGAGSRMEPSIAGA